MIGLKYLINLYGYKNKEIADKLSVNPVTIHDWTKGKRKIPVKRIEELSEIFVGIPTRYFQLQLSSIDEQEIQNIKLRNEMNEKDFGDMVAANDAELILKRSLESFKKSVRKKVTTETIGDFTHEMNEQVLIIKLLSEIMGSDNYNLYMFKRLLFSVILFIKDDIEGEGDKIKRDDFVNELLAVMNKEDSRLKERKKLLGEDYDIFE